jgi:hypothetical protein
MMVAVALLGCEKQSDQSANSAGVGGAAANAAESAAGKRLAVSHSFTIRVPSNQVESVQQKHLAECRKLGCTVLSTRLDRLNEGRINAALSVRVAPDAYAGFATIITQSPAELVSHVETAEDKTLPILDVEKRLEVKLALRDRLTAMLRDPGPKSAADIASIEKELAQVQGDIEAATAQRDYLRTITETVKVDVFYNGTTAQAGGIDLSPIDRAIRGFGFTIVTSVAALISFLAALIPWLPVVAAAVWGIRWGIRRWKARKGTA